MKKLLVVAFLYLGSLTSAQQRLIADVDAMKTDNNVIAIDSSNAESLYKKTIKWVNETYQNPKTIIKAEVPNEMIRLEALRTVTSNRFMGMTTDNELIYTLQIDFKDGKLRYSIFGLRGIGNFSYQNCFKNDGTRRNTKEITTYLTDIELSFNELIDNYILFLKKPNDNW